MSVVGEDVTVMASTDPTKVGLKGTVVLETARTLLLAAGKRRLTVEKNGVALKAEGAKSLLAGDDIAGRLEDRLGGRKA